MAHWKNSRCYWQFGSFFYICIAKIFIMNKLILKHLIIGAIILSGPIVSKAQVTAKDYTPLTSTGTLPEEFLKTARSVSEEEVKNIGYGMDRQARQQFVISNNYFLRDLLLGGDVLINDPLTIYVNKVVDEILKNNPMLRQQLHVYVTKSPDVNAYAFDKGYVFVNVGLLAQLENEAQLAFVLAHEITHVVKKHSVNQYMENIRLENGTSSYERGSYDERSLAKYRFSKEQEGEADAEALKLLKDTKYSIKALNGAFDVLQYSYLPFELVDFKKSFFEDEYLKLPDTLILKKTSEVKANDDYDDSKSTHPNIRKRRGSIEPELKVGDESSRKKYLVSEEEFKSTRETSRFELCRLYLVERDYVNAIYAAYILQEKYPENLYLKKIIAKALYNISVNKSPSTHSTISIGDGSFSSKTYSVEDYEKIEGASQRLYYLLDNLTAKELNVVALSYTFKAHKKFPEDPTLSTLTDSLFSELINSNNLFLGDFSRQTKAQLKSVDTAKVAVVDSSDVEESKYSKIKKQQQKVEVETEENFTKYAFVGLLKDDEFASLYNKASHGQMSPTIKEDYIRVSASTANKKQKGDPFLGIEKVVFIDPFYMKVKNERGNEFVNYYESEDGQAVLLDIQKKCADRLNLQYTTITTKGLTASDMERYNENALLNEWLGERFKHGNNNDEVVTSSENIKQLVDKLGTKYVAWSGIYNSKGKAYRNTYFFIVFNLETGEMMKFETRYTRAKDSKDLLSSFVYNSLMHVAKKK